MKVFEKLQKKFQHIFMLNLSTRGDRRYKMIQQLFDFGLPTKFRQSQAKIISLTIKLSTFTFLQEFNTSTLLPIFNSTKFSQKKT